LDCETDSKLARESAEAIGEAVNVVASAGLVIAALAMSIKIALAEPATPTRDSFTMHPRLGSIAMRSLVVHRSRFG